jgi:N-acetylmuramoyl-L-alanine amidase
VSRVAFFRIKAVCVLALTGLLLPISAEARRHRAPHAGSQSPHAKTASSSLTVATRHAPADFSTVVVDAGHGGHDLGGIPENLIPEKNVALDVAQRLAHRLEAAGLRVVMTRPDDTFITLGQRVRIANAESDAIFVSIHFNATQRTDARGVESFYGSASSAPLAHLIQRKLLTISSNPDFRPVKHATFWVLRETKLPAVLAECGFLTNPEDTALAQKEEYREKLSEQIASAILEYRHWLADPSSSPAVPSATDAEPTVSSPTVSPSPPPPPLPTP